MVELNGLKRSVQEIARTVGALVEEKLGERSQVEEQVRNVARQVEKMVGEAIVKGATFAAAAANSASNVSTADEPRRVTLKFKRLPNFKGELPAYATAGASGLDVRAVLEEPLVLEPGQRHLIPTGLSAEFPVGYELQVRPRSGLAISKGISMVNTPGTVDADYRGELKVILINHGQEPVTIQDQERIAQLVLCPVILADVVDAEDLSETDRGAGGFGSTGV